MAERAARHAKPVISYSSLHNLCDAIYTEKRRKHGKKTVGKLYEAERIIERRNGPNTKEYLVKWVGYPTWQSSWEPEENLNEALRRSYERPQPGIAEIDEFCLAFYINVLQGLKSPGVDAHVYVPFRLDVWRYLAQDKGRKANQRGAYLLEKDEFDRFTHLPNHWYYFLNLHGEGNAIDFPIRIRPFLGRLSAKDFVVGANNTLTKAPILSDEKLSIYFVKKACNINNV